MRIRAAALRLVRNNFHFINSNLFTYYRWYCFSGPYGTLTFCAKAAKGASAAILQRRRRRGGA